MEGASTRKIDLAQFLLLRVDFCFLYACKINATSEIHFAAVSQKKKSAAVRNRSRNLSTVFFQIVNTLRVRRPSARLVACVAG